MQRSVISFILVVSTFFSFTRIAPKGPLAGIFCSHTFVFGVCIVEKAYKLRNYFSIVHERTLMIECIRDNHILVYCVCTVFQGCI